MAPNNENWSISRGRSYNIDLFPTEEQDVSSAIAASLDERLYGTSELQTVILMSLDEMNKMNKMKTESNQDQAQAIDDFLVKTEDNNSREEHGKVTGGRGIPRVENFELRLRDLVEMNNWELPRPDDSKGDTLVFIDPPDQQPEQDDESYERCSARYNIPIRMKKDVFMKYGASYFQKIFEATYQFRILRRRGLVGKLPPHVKYVVDLTPPTDGDQAAYLMTELCCSEGVRKWYQANKRWEVSKNMVAGQDEYMLRRKAGSGTAEHGSESDQFPLVPLEYSPVRHRSAVERVLLALQNRNPWLDSAPKVWSTFAVAKYFGITTDSPLTDYIVSWLRAAPNSHFLEVLPEIALRIADGLQCHELCRDTFAILVGEEALGAAYRSRVPEFDRSWSVHGRKKDEFPEGLQTAVEYASKALSDRVNAKFTSLVDDGMHWIDDLAEFQKLSNLGPLPENLEQDLTELIVLLKAYVRGAVYTVLCMNFPHPPIIVAGISEDDVFPTTRWEEIWAKLVPRERILTRDFWSMLSRSDLLRGPTNFHVCFRLPNGILMASRGHADEAVCQELSFNKISNRDIALRILSLNEQYHQYHVTLVEGPNSNEQISHNGSSLFDNEKADPLQALKRPPVNYDPADFFHFGTFCNEAERYLKTLGSWMTNAPDISTRKEVLEVKLIHTLVCLIHSEWKYLPMWAGGNDDGSGGVFADDVPLTHDGFSTAGPKVITENQYSADGNSTGSSFSVISHSGTSRPNTSLLNNNSFSDALPRDIAVSNDGESLASSSTFDSYDMVPTDPNSDEVDEKIQNVPTMLDGMEINDIGAAQDENVNDESVKLNEAFDDIFAYSSDEEEDDDGDTINGDDPTETDMNEDDN